MKLRIWLKENTFLFWLGIITPVGLMVALLLTIQGAK